MKPTNKIRGTTKEAVTVVLENDEPIAVLMRHTKNRVPVIYGLKKLNVDDIAELMEGGGLVEAVPVRKTLHGIE